MQRVSVMNSQKYRYNLILSIWIMLLISITMIASLTMSSRINDYKAKYDSNNISRIILIEQDDMNFVTNVSFGTYINRISRLSMKDSNFDIDFYIWFKWNGDEVSPGENFQIVNGQINLKQKQAEWHEGDDHYEQYQVFASITKPFDVMLFPFDNYKLQVEIEDSYNSIDELQYIPENNENGKISPELTIPGYCLRPLDPISELHTYSTNFGSPWNETNPSIYSRIVFGIGIARDGYGLYFKLFQSLFVAVSVALLGFFLKPDYAPRFVAGIGALFAAVANYYTILSMQPIVGFVTLADSINLIGILTILLSLIESSISLFIYEHLENRDFYWRFDKYSIVTFILCYIFINWWIVAIAID